MVKSGPVNLGLIGYPLGHSFSARYFTEKFEREGIPGNYSLFPIESIDCLQALLDSHPNLRGLNVTIPYKQSVLPILDSISQDAAAIGAVNVIRIDHDAEGHRSLHGFNTDWRGFLDSLRPFLRPDITRALVLGTGGASKAVEYALGRIGIGVTLVSRHPSKRGIISYSDITPELIGATGLIVNTTPLGMYPNIESAPDIPYDLLDNCHICFDLVYNPAMTQFMRLAEKSGATVVNGLDMLYRQADLSAEIFMPNR